MLAHVCRAAFQSTHQQAKALWGLQDYSAPTASGLYQMLPYVLPISQTIVYLLHCPYPKPHVTSSFCLKADKGHARV
jgi:hypothetical protein